LRIRDLLDLLAPSQCLACGSASGETLCRVCHDGAPWRDASDDAPPPGTTDLFACPTLLWLEGPVGAWVHRFKYPAAGWSGFDGPASGLVSWLAERLGGRLAPGPHDLVVPIPLHGRRLRARGFNPALVLARDAFAQWGTPVCGRVLARTRNTPSQTGLDRAQRRANVHGAFSCEPRPDWPPECVWLVDDVITTGATLAAAASVLRASGVARVIGVGLARTRAEIGVLHDWGSVSGLAASGGRRLA
jgi:ComF family protein